jgi:hypothetical protein
MLATALISKPSYAKKKHSPTDPLSKSALLEAMVNNNSEGSSGIECGFRGTCRQRLANLGDAQYTLIVKVGGQNLNAVIDTGSFDFVVFGRNCSACGNLEDLYDGSKSKTYTSTATRGTNTYGSGTTYSKQAFDYFSTEGEPMLSVKNQSFWEVYVPVCLY